MIQKLNPSILPLRPGSITDSDTPQHNFTARLINSVDELDLLTHAWQRLMETAVHRNLMFDPDFLIPAFRHLAHDSVRILVIEAPQKSKPNGPSVLCGLIPLEKVRLYGMPLSAVQVWLHDQCADGTPLLRSDCAAEVLSFIFDFLAKEEKTSLLGLNTISNEGPFSQILTDVLYTRQSPVFYRNLFARACFRPEMDAESYFEQHVSKGVQKTQRRLARRLAEKGDVSVSCCRDGTFSKKLIEDFLRLEASGWKAEAGTAIQSSERRQCFFQEMVTRSMLHGKLSFLTLHFNGQPVSMLCDLYCDHLGYSFKTAFDNAMKEFSPGMMIELRNIESMHEQGVELMDSCTVPDNQALNRIWGDRLRFQDLIVPLHGRMSRWAVAVMPLMQQLRRTFSKCQR